MLNTRLADGEKQSAKPLLLEDIENNIDAFGMGRAGLDKKTLSYMGHRAVFYVCGLKITI